MVFFFLFFFFYKVETQSSTDLSSLTLNTDVFGTSFYKHTYFALFYEWIKDVMAVMFSGDPHLAVIHLHNNVPSPALISVWTANHIGCSEGSLHSWGDSLECSPECLTSFANEKLPYQTLHCHASGGFNSLGNGRYTYCSEEAPNCCTINMSNSSTVKSTTS